MSDIKGFVIQVSPHATEDAMVNLTNVLACIKGVTSVTPITKPFEWYSLYHSIEQEIANKLIAALTT